MVFISSLFFAALTATSISAVVVDKPPLARRNSDANECLTAHNAKRQQVAREDNVSVPDLQWSDDLAAQAQSWATHLMQTNTFEHSSLGNGENLYLFGISDGSLTDDGKCGDAVEAWFSERPNYHGVIDDGFETYGHYTQVVWPSTQTVGCATAVTADGITKYFVCEYQPPGNVVGSTEAPI